MSAHGSERCEVQIEAGIISKIRECTYCPAKQATPSTGECAMLETMKADYIYALRSFWTKENIMKKLRANCFTFVSAGCLLPIEEVRSGLERMGLTATDIAYVTK